MATYNIEDIPHAGRLDKIGLSINMAVVSTRARADKEGRREIVSEYGCTRYILVHCTMVCNVGTHFKGSKIRSHWLKTYVKLAGRFVTSTIVRGLNRYRL